MTITIPPEDIWKNWFFYDRLVKLSDVEKMIEKEMNSKDWMTQWTEVETLQSILDSLSSLTTQDSKKLALDFADWYHNGLSNAERKSVEEEFERFINLQ